MKLLLFCTLFVGWISYYLCQRTLPSAMTVLIPGSPVSRVEDEPRVFQAFSKAYFGQLQSLFSVAYSTSFLLSGIMSDLVSVRALFAVCLALSGLFLAIFPWTEGHHFFGLVVYFLLGLSEGCAWPFVSKILRQTYLPSELGVPFGVFSVGSSCAFFFSPLLIASGVDWKYSFYAIGLVTIGLAIPIYFITTTVPVYVNCPTKIEKQKLQPRWFTVLLVRDLWSVMAIHSVLWLVRATIPDWGHLYLIQERGFERASAGIVTRV